MACFVYSNGKYDIAVESKVGTLDSAEILYEDDIIGNINVEDAGQKGTFNLVSRRNFGSSEFI